MQLLFRFALSFFTNYSFIFHLYYLVIYRWYLKQTAAEAQAQRLQQNIETALQAEKAAIASAEEAADAYLNGQGTRSGALSAIQAVSYTHLTLPTILRV